MGQNSDINNIFNSYRNNVLLNEAVKPTEETGTATSQAEQDPNWVKAKTAWENYTGKKFDELPSAQRISVSQKHLRPAAKQGYLIDPRTNKQIPLDGGSTAPQTTQPQQPVAAQPAPQPAPQPTPQQPAQTEADDESGYEEVETTTQNVTNTQSQTQPLVTSDDGTSYTADDIKKMINDLKMEPVASADNEQNDEENEEKDSGWEEVGTAERENVTDQAKKISTVAEKHNIAKFLKCLSEKNYSLANKYLSNIIKNKVKSKISGEIK